jgi:hypothetical protein
MDCDDSNLDPYGLDSQRHYVAALSLWALVSGHWSAWQAARTEVKQEEDEKKREQERVGDDVVEEILDKTELQPDTS